MKPLETPVLFCVFNRPTTTKLVFEAIRSVKPKYLFIEADGPRKDRESDHKNCAEVRNLISNIDWDCEVKTLFREENLGCQRAVTGGINWFFEHVSEGIILEDDCLPTTNFFYYCQEVLQRYRDDTRVVHVNGNNYNSPYVHESPYSYHFTYIPQVWGWATWRRAWSKFEETMAMLPQFDHPLFFKHAGLTATDYKKIRTRWYKVYNGTMLDNVWDYQWHFINLLEGSLVVSPVKNQVSNLGFSGEATHSPLVNPLKAQLPVFEMEVPLHHPPCLFIDEKLNQYYKEMMINESLFTKVRRKLLKKGIRIPVGNSNS